MGLAKKILEEIETKAQGPQKPAPHRWPADQAWAKLLASQRNPGNRGDPNQDGAPTMLDDLIGKAAGVPYRFELEIHRPDRADYELDRRERVPSKVEGTLFLRSHSIPPGAEVPLVVEGPGEDDISLDWDAYLELPDQKARAYYLRIEARYAQAGRKPPWQD